MARISAQQLLEVVAGFDKQGGASLGLVAWELCVDERDVQPAWEDAIAKDWLTPAEREPTGDEQLHRLTPDGWAAARKCLPRLKTGPEADEDSQ